ncbi:hypothetical protein LJU02_02440 [Corynebacterium pseudotuberculosis]|uniref:Uncharacterized protein n=2 Tax=Corynebacterium pseudotuberculosis TaxID=1719 RepID=D9QEM8_CORP2|nr:hypothetical protein [Corynebacterium pseudotuberculosis]AER68547.1 Hypothetical protein Cp106_0451 [Corynebacterium pseudotuberculosis 1/06-A]ADK28258.1 hypothetical protein CPFRC_02340 [Corynebacterium pseudotuberculosis FRC41]ADL09951.1 hypothetical protein CPC231_02340 [Corynebacterium pseudotuberculosis C231]ADL20356.1 hypothetical protein CP1002_02340 [Corynebacterium pseudotuberculosis 1002]AEK91795.1 Hypothetical protein CpPAT10_0465 [Corynebacterium pseudotuberculosis PAT10]
MRVKSLIAMVVGLVLFVGAHFMIGAYDVSSMLWSIIMGVGGAMAVGGLVGALCKEPRKQ